MTKPSFVAESERTDGYTHVLLITTGSVASIKAPLIVSELLQVNIGLHLLKLFIAITIQYSNVKVEVVSTKSSLTFIDIKAVKDAGARTWVDEDEWTVRPLALSSCVMELQRVLLSRRHIK
jgi:phosphopantothenoylcysteine decarboxylase